MRISRTSIFACTLIVIAAAIPVACGGTGATGQSGATGTGGTSGHTGSGMGGELFGDGGVDDIVTIVISPADPVIEVLNGAIPPATMFTATGTTKLGGMVPLTGDWSYDRLDAANIGKANGALTATGLKGGKGTVTFSYGGLTATTSALVKLHITSEPGPVDPTIKGQFGQAGQADPTMNFLYPYDKTVFPRGLVGPVIQWNGGAASDVYYLHATSPAFEYEFWGTVPPPARYSLADDVWKKLTA